MLIRTCIILHVWIGQLSQYSTYIVESVKGAILRIRGPLMRPIHVMLPLVLGRISS